MISEDCVRESFGTDLSKVLLRDILEVHKYWCQLSSKQWSQLLHLYCVILKESPPGLDHRVLAEVIHVIVVGACQQSDVRVKKILPLFLDYFSRVKEEPSPSVLEHVVSSINVLSRSIAINGRVQVSRLGETIFIPLFYLWKNQHNDRLKDEIVNFLQLQMSIHHPHGARTEEEGAFSVNSHLWKVEITNVASVQVSTQPECVEDVDDGHTENVMSLGWISQLFQTVLMKYNREVLSEVSDNEPVIVLPTCHVADEVSSDFLCDMAKYSDLRPIHIPEYGDCVPTTTGIGLQITTLKPE
ncbi:Serine-protein kinase ATM [Lamellibrachia satsuma]|nr:Serine-protein kinase ATM [Lamellibrachia satsuma]